VPTLLRSAVNSRDPDFIYHTLDVLSKFVKTNAHEMMWHAQNSVETNERETCLLLDIEDVAVALDELWCANDILMDGLLQLQPAPYPSKLN